MYIYTCIYTYTIQSIPIHKGDYDDLPPPIPTKRHGTPRGGTSPSITPHSHPSSFTPPSMTRDGPVLPIRIDSIPGLRNKLESIGTPPPKPPRNLQPHGSSEVSLFIHTHIIIHMHTYLFKHTSVCVVLVMATFSYS